MVDIVQTGNPVLRKKARQLAIEEIRSDIVQDIIVCMRDTMRKAPGIGLAAPQIGLQSNSLSLKIGRNTMKN